MQAKRPGFFHQRYSKIMWKDKADVLAGLRHWMAQDPSLANKPIASGANRTFTLSETIDEIDKETEFGKKLLEASLDNTGHGCCDDESCGCE